jgi:hypothetical protein
MDAIVADGVHPNVSVYSTRCPLRDMLDILDANGSAVDKGSGIMPLYLKKTLSGFVIAIVASYVCGTSLDSRRC